MMTYPIDHSPFAQKPKGDDYYKLDLQIWNTYALPFQRRTRFSLYQIHVLNMHLEDFAPLADRLQDKKVWTRVFVQEVDSDVHKDRLITDYWCCINDGRLPADCYLDHLIWLGAPRPTVETATRIYEWFSKDPEGLKQFTDPDSYWAKLGARHERGTVSFFF